MAKVQNYEHKWTRVGEPYFTASKRDVQLVIQSDGGISFVITLVGDEVESLKKSLLTAIRLAKKSTKTDLK